MIPTHRIVKAPWNYKETDEARARQLEAKIKREGAIVNLIIRHLPDQTSGDGGPLFEAIDGNHRIDAYLKAGREEAMCYNKGQIPQEHAKRIAVEVNEGDFEADPVALAETLADIEKHFGREDWMETSPFSETEMENFNDMLNFDWDAVEPAEDGEQEGAEDPTSDPDHWETLEFILADEQMAVWEEATERVEKQLAEEGLDLPDDPAVRRGQILELIAAEHLNGPFIDPQDADVPEEEPPF
jgi:hypothetical protein